MLAHDLGLLERGIALGRDNGAGVSHAPTLRRGNTRHVADHGLRHVLLRPCRGLGFLRAANLPDHDDGPSVRVRLEQLKVVQKRAAVDRIAANAHARRDPKPKCGELGRGLVAERP